MPFVKISSLPGMEFSRAKVMEAMEDDFAETANLPVGTASFIWQTLDCITHRMSGKKEYRSCSTFDTTEKEIPLFVDLYLTSVFDYDGIAKIMKSIVRVLVAKTGINEKYVFIHTHVAQPGHVFISGNLWPEEPLIHPGTKSE